MHRREVLRAGAGLAALLALPAVGCAATPGTPVVRSTGSTSGTATPAGGVLQANLTRAGGAAPAAARGRFLAQAAALYRTGLTGSDNAVLSPYSILVAVGMAGLGARASSATAFADFFHGDATDVAAALTSVDIAVAGGISGPRTGGREELPVVDAADNLYLQRGLDVQQAYLDALARGYGAGVRIADFAADPDGSRTLINSWVSQRTHQLIPTLLPDGSITTDTLLVLVNALYFKAAWTQPFRVVDTAAPFTTTAGRVQATYLKVPVGALPTASGAGWRSVTLPFVGDRLAMTIILPDQGRFAAVSAGLSADVLEKALFGSSTLVSAQLPKFATATPTDLSGTLQSLGLEVLFSAAADFSGIAGRPGDILLKKAIHQARISVDENGTEAAAATALTMIAGSAPGQQETPIEFTVDRPFLFLVHDTDTGMPFFLGRVTDPTR